MNINEVKSKRLNDSYFKIDHPTGLTIYVYPKQDYNSTYAIIGTRYGSVNTCFSIDGGEKITVPDGIAHYLEHKLFESEDGDAFARYAKTGASANAYTSFDKTCYLFSCTDNFKESLEILLDFVQNPFFTAQTVAKEQGIIGQEIKMYDDSPDWRVMFNMLEGMYSNHPVKIDIAGTVESIAEITAEKLYEVYNVFYNLNNMVLCVAGKATVDEVLEVADRMLKPCEKHKIENYFEDEPYEVKEKYVEQKFPITMPVFNLGFKENAERALNSTELAKTTVLLTMLASPSSEMYRELTEKNLINSSFTYELFEGPGYRSVFFGGESREPEKAAEIIKRYITDFKNKPLDSEEFEIAVKSVYGESVFALDSIGSIAGNMIDMYFSGNELFESVEVLAELTEESTAERLKDMLDVDNCTLSVVKSCEAEK